MLWPGEGAEELPGAGAWGRRGCGWEGRDWERVGEGGRVGCGG